MDTSDDLGSAILLGTTIFGAVAGSKAIKSATAGSVTPTVESASGIKSVQAGVSDAESRRRQVFSQLAKSRKATLVAKTNQPEPLLKINKLGPG